LNLKKIIKWLERTFEKGNLRQYYSDLYSDFAINRDEYLMLLKRLDEDGEQGEAEKK
jgi:hypothetical protein